MLFDLRGRGRRRTIQVIYASLALLMGGGLIFFGIGGATSGGLFDALGGGNGGSSSGNDIVQKRMKTLEARVQRDPSDQRSWSELAKARFQTATTGANFDQSTQTYTDAGRAELVQAGTAWQRYLALNPPKPDPNLAIQMVTAYGQAGLQQYDKATQAMEYVIDARPPTAALYAQLAVLAHGAKQDRKSDLAASKATDLTPKAQRKQLKTQIDTAKSQLDQANAATATQGTTTG